MGSCQVPPGVKMQERRGMSQQFWAERFNFYEADAVGEIKTRRARVLWRQYADLAQPALSM